MGEPTTLSREELLQPTLGTAKPPEAVYSAKALFFTAFFGGPFAVIILSALNARLLGRLTSDLWRYLLAAGATIAFFVGLVFLASSDPPPEWFQGALGDMPTRTVRYVNRAFALLVWVALYFPYRRYQKAADLAGLDPRNPWKPAILCIVPSAVLQIGLVTALRAFFST